MPGRSHRNNLYIRKKKGKLSTEKKRLKGEARPARRLWHAVSFTTSNTTPLSYFSFPLYCRLPVFGSDITFPCLSLWCQKALKFIYPDFFFFPFSFSLTRLSRVRCLTGFLRAAWKRKYNFYVPSKRKRRDEKTDKRRNRLPCGSFAALLGIKVSEISVESTRRSSAAI